MVTILQTLQTLQTRLRTPRRRPPPQVVRVPPPRLPRPQTPPRRLPPQRRLPVLLQARTRTQRQTLARRDAQVGRFP